MYPCGPYGLFAASRDASQSGMSISCSHTNCRLPHPHSSGRGSRQYRLRLAANRDANRPGWLIPWFPPHPRANLGWNRDPFTRPLCPKRPGGPRLPQSRFEQRCRSGMSVSSFHPDPPSARPLPATVPGISMLNPEGTSLPLQAISPALSTLSSSHPTTDDTDAASFHPPSR